MVKCPHGCEIIINSEFLPKIVYEAWAPNHPNTWKSLPIDSGLREVIVDISKAIIAAEDTVLEIKEVAKCQDEWHLGWKGLVEKYGEVEANVRYQTTRTCPSNCGAKIEYGD